MLRTKFPSTPHNSILAQKGTSVTKSPFSGKSFLLTYPLQNQQYLNSHSHLVLATVSKCQSLALSQTPGRICKIPSAAVGILWSRRRGPDTHPASAGQEQTAPLAVPQGGWGNWSQVIYPRHACFANIYAHLWDCWHREVIGK